MQFKDNYLKSLKLIKHDDFSSLFYPDDCDGHWNKKGNIWAAKIISNYINKNKKN
jgi:hypothetical protein